MYTLVQHRALSLPHLMYHEMPQHNDHVHRYACKDGSTKSSMPPNKGERSSTSNERHKRACTCVTDDMIPHIVSLTLVAKISGVHLSNVSAPRRCTTRVDSPIHQLPKFKSRLIETVESNSLQHSD